MWKRTYINHEFKRLMIAGILMNGLIAVKIYIDKLIAGIVLGSVAASAVNLIAPIAGITMSIAYFATIGFPIIFNDAMGRFDKEHADNIFGMGVITSIGTGLLNVALCLAVKIPFYQFYEITGDIRSFCDPYFYWMLPVVFLMPIGSYIDDMVLTDGDDTVVIIAKVSEVVIKVILSVLFGLLMGLKGIAIGSLISSLVALIINGTHFLKKENSLKFKWFFDFGELATNLKLGVVDGAYLIFDAVFCMALNKIVLLLMGPEYLIVVTVVCLFEELGLVFDGLDQALEPFINVFLAQGSNDGIRQTMRIAFGWANTVAVVIGAIIFALAGWISGIMGITDPELVRICTVGLRILVVSYPLLSQNYLFTSYYLYIDHVWLSVWMEFMDVIIFNIICPLAGVVLWGPVGLFIGLAAANLMGICVSLLIIRLRFGAGGFPLILEYGDGITDDRVWDYDLEESYIMNAVSSVEAFLTDCGRNRKDIITAMTLVEELSMLAKEMNPGERIMAECSVVVGDDITLIFCNTGRIIDMTDSNARVDSFRQYFVSNYMGAKCQTTHNLVTTGLNRCRFTVTSTAESDLRNSCSMTLLRH